MYTIEMQETTYPFLPFIVTEKLVNNTKKIVKKEKTILN